MSKHVKRFINGVVYNYSHKITRGIFAIHNWNFTQTRHDVNLDFRVYKSDCGLSHLEPCLTKTWYSWQGYENIDYTKE